jgi:hypothetical protein
VTKRLILLLATVSFLSFAEEHGLQTQITERTEGGRTVIEISGKSPEEFYKQFNYHIVTAEDGSKWHKVIGGGIMSAMEYIPLKNGNYGEIDLFMQKDGTYTAQYTELKKLNPGHYSGMYSKTFKGKWYIQGSELVFEGLGKARGGTYTQSSSATKAEESFPVLNFKFDNDIKTPGLIDGMIVLGLNSSTAGPDRQNENYNLYK